ncbi:MAG: DHH family phosphoesterase [Candidatus Nitrosocaldus sp.]|nr:DHH family phosphoesterase [Candidatus Nitrosocaldus sp.]MDW8275692.1 DHH family phosphoesterase [Candidatus Nitrosocaldus sp.]
MVRVCLSHKEDPDGIVSASMIKYAYGTRVMLADYSDLLQRLEEAVSVEGLEHLFICDMGLSKANEERFFDLVEQACRGSRVTYIDHHHLEERSKERLRGYGVELVHDIAECTSILIYHRLLNEQLPSRFALLAGLAAIIDEMGDREVAGRILGSYDRHFVEFEATMLAYAIYQNQHRQEFLLALVDGLMQSMPHAVDGVLESAKEYAEKITNSISVIESDANRDGDVVYIQAVDLPASTVANMLLAMHKGIKVAIAYKQRGDKMVVSLRGSSLCRLHLGKVANDVASELGGSGGGHDKASGAMVPKDSIDTFVERIKGFVNGSR